MNMNAFRFRCFLASLILGPLLSRAAGTGNLSVTTTPSTYFPITGQQVVFQLVLTNSGTGPAFGISVTNFLSPGLQYVSNTGGSTNGTYNSATGIWSVSSLTPLASVSISVTVTAAAAGYQTNEVSVGESFGGYASDTAVLDVTASAPPSLAVTTTPDIDFPVVGDEVIFQWVLTNSGAGGITTNITVTNFLSAGLQYVSYTGGGGGNGTYNSGTGLWTVPGLAPDSSASLSVTTSATAAGDQTNTISVGEMGGYSSDSAILDVTEPEADLGVMTTASSNSLAVGQEATFLWVLTNAGPDNVDTMIDVTNFLSAGLQYVSDTSGGAYNPGTGMLTVTGLLANSSISVSLVAKAVAAGFQTNTISVGVPAGYNDPNPGNNTASAVVNVTNALPQADLAVTKTASTNSVKFGQPVIYTVLLRNLGPNNVTNNIVVTDCLPVGFQYITDSTYGNATNGVYSPGTCEWTWSSGLAAGAGATLTITAQATSVGTFTNTASVAVPAGITDPNLANNTSSAVVTVTPLVADLAVTKTVFTNTMPVFSTFAFSFTLTVTNLGPDTVSNVTLTDLLPAGLPFSGAILNPSNTYTASNGLWTVAGALAPGQGTSIGITALASNVGTFTNTLMVNVPTNVMDPNLNNNTASTVVYVLPLYRILGNVANCSSNGLPLANVTLTLSGAANQTTTTFGIGNGNYSFNNVSNGIYTITPSQPGNVFMPPSAMVTVSNAWVTVPTFVGGIGLIYGQVSYFGNPVTNHPVTLSGGGLARPRLVLTDVNGYYIFTNTPAGNYTVTAVATNGYVFTPTNPAVILDAVNCAALTNFTATIPRTVQLVALEVNQVIQDWSNSVRLIQNKETYVRAHLQVTNTTPVLLQSPRLYGTSGGNPLPLSPLPPLNTGGTLMVAWTNAGDRMIRGNLPNSFNFRLPPSWLSGNISLRFECTNNVTVVPTNVVPANSTVSVAFVPSAIPQIKFVGYNWTNAGVYQQLDAPAFADLPRRLVSIYPVPANTINSLVRFPPTILPVPTTIPPAIAATEGPGDWALLNSNARLKAQKEMDFLISRIFGGGNWIYYGALAWPSPDTLGWAGSYVTSANTIGKTSSVSSGFVNPTFYPPGDGLARHTAEHEIGHNLGRPHDVMATGDGVCNEGGPTNAVYPLFQPVVGGAIKPTIGPMTNGVNSLIYGLDTLTLKTAPAQNPVVDPNVFFDLMSYCRVGPLDRWISTYTYNALYAAITNSFTAPPPAVGAPGPPQRWQLLRGFVDGGAEAGILMPVLTVTTTNVPPAPQPGNYFLQLYDANTNLLSEISFTPDSYEKDENTSDPDFIADFVVPVPADPTVRQIALWQGTNFLDMKIASSNAPVVSFITLSSTNGGPFAGSGPLVINWTASDADGDALTYTVQYSADDGSTWETLFVDWPYESCMIDSQYLEATTQGEIRVVASDGFNTSTDTFSGIFTVPNHAPTVSINTPPADTLFVGDQEIFLDAFANDPQDGALDGNSVQWFSSLDGSLGNGAVLNLDANTLTEGTHLITVTAMDSEGLTNSASVQIFVLHQPPPQLTIQYADNQVLLSWPSSITNFVLQSSSNLLEGSWTSVTNAPVAADATQTVTLDVSGQPAFFRLQMLP